jgi:hypothetical protein
MSELHCLRCGRPESMHPVVGKEWECPELQETPPDDGRTTPWTEGPWLPLAGAIERPDGFVGASASYAFPQSAYRPWDRATQLADAMLVAMSPEMAALISRLAANYRASMLPHTTPCVDSESCDRCLTIAMDERLQALWKPLRALDAEQRLRSEHGRG